MKIKINSIGFVVLLLMLIIPNFTLASNTDGTIDTTYKYAWSEKIGWINFGVSSGNVHVTDARLTGNAWSENYGWINLQPTGSGVTNDSNGNLSGSAWGEQIGYISFSGVTIDSVGDFHGYASSTVTGQISFNCLNTSSCASSSFKTKTDWISASSRNSGGGGGGGGGGSYLSPPNSTILKPQSLPASSNTSSESQPANNADSFNKDLSVGLKSSDVKQLQQFLNSNGFVISSKGIGSVGNEGNYFGNSTKSALIKFQQVHQDQGLLSELGKLGPKTRAYINSLGKQSGLPVVTTKQPPKVCSPYLLKYIKLGKNNDSNEVVKLQKFLKQYEGFTDVAETGIYDQVTFNAVVSFQQKYAQDVLGPWQSGKSTGYVYKTTVKKINEIYCSEINKTLPK